MKMIVYSPEKTVFSGEVQMAEFPGGRGRFQVLENHDALVSTLVAGEIRYRVDGEEFRQSIQSGYVEVFHNVISVCVHLS